MSPPTSPNVIHSTFHLIINFKVKIVEDGCCPFKIVFDEDLYVVFDEDFYVHFMCIFALL